MPRERDGFGHEPMPAIDKATIIIVCVLIIAVLISVTAIITID